MSWASAEVLSHRNGDDLDASTEAERALVAVFVGMRLYHLASAGVSVWLDRSRYRRPTVATALLAAVAVESAWLLWRHHVRGHPLDRRAMTVDVAVGAAALAVCSTAVLPDEQFTSVNWAFPMNLWTCVGTSTGFSRPGAVGATGLLIGIYGVATAGQSRRLHRETGFGAVQYIGGWVIGDLVVRRLRRTAVQIRELHGEAVERAAAIAEAEMRASLQRDLHGRALETLELVRSGLVGNPDEARAAARAEAARLRRALRGEESIGLARELESAVSEAVGRGIVVELIHSAQAGAPELSAAVIEALAGAVRTMLGGCEPGDDGSRALVRSAPGGAGGTEVTLHYRGVYRGDVDTEAPGAALAAVGGELVVRRPPGGGVRAVITVAAVP